MKPLYLCFAALFCISILSKAQSSNPHRDPSDFQPPINRGEGIIGGSNNAHSLEQPDEVNPPRRKMRVDAAQIRRDADELSRLAQSISSEVAETEKGTLPKDLADRLKRIQKLSKQIRDELKL